MRTSSNVDNTGIIDKPLVKGLPYTQTARKGTDDSVLGVMDLFNNEGYYKYAIEVLWSLREIAMKTTERETAQGVYWDKNHPYYWLAEITNEIIGRALIDGYNYIGMGHEGWFITSPRDANTQFLTYEEAKFIAGIAQKERLMDELYRLRDLTGRYANDPGNPAHCIHEVANDLIFALSNNPIREHEVSRLHKC